MPGISFVLPHWIYWLGLLLFPVVAMILARKTRLATQLQATQANISKPAYPLQLSYFIWLVGGFLGLHRFYLKSLLGFLYLPLFLFILYATGQDRVARVELSNATNQVELQEKTRLRHEKSIERSSAKIEKSQSALQNPDLPDASKSRHTRTIEREEQKIEKSEQAIADSTTIQQSASEQAERYANLRTVWQNASLYSFLALVAFLLFDLFRIPKLSQHAQKKLEQKPESHPEAGEDSAETDQEETELKPGSGLLGKIDQLTLWTGEFVAFWSVIAVFVYYYEVIARYMFNSPSNWAHESMFIMFGMQYLVAGAYAMLSESHVRVDIFYARFSRRGKALVDLLTSVFFFIFAGTLFVTGWIFAADSIGVWEVSFTEWGIQYWPVKCTLVLGGALLLLQGGARFCRDFVLVFGPEPQEAKTA